MKTKNLCKLLLPLCTFTLFSCSVKSMDTPARTVSVYGSGKVMIESNQFAINLAVTTRNADINLAVEENNLKIQEVKAALKKEGLPESAISTANYSVYQEQDYTDKGIVTGLYRINNGVNVQFDDVTKIGKIISAAIQAGANSISSLSYSAKNTDEAVKQARLLALKQAEEKAMTLASASGRELGRIIQISEEPNSDYPRTATTSEYAKSARSDVSVNPADSSVSVTLHAVYQLK